jgi:hypothetical protein
VHASLSSHGVLFGFAGFEHVPSTGLQAPIEWHWSDAAQVFGFVPVHVPPWHESDCVHPLLSLQAVLFGFAGFEQRPLAGLHVPAVWH